MDLRNRGKKLSRNYVKFARLFEACDIDASDFSHRDHLGVAFEFLRTYDFLNAAAKYSQCIKTIAIRAGATTKFNTTITIAFLSIVAERMESESHKGFDEFLEHNPDLMSRDLLAKWYSPERLGSDHARSQFLMPDVTP